MKKTVLFLLVVLCLTADAQKGRVYCRAPGDTEDQNLICYCLSYHEDWCQDENAPIPSCCKAGERDEQTKKPKMNGCLCCAHKKAANLDERGWFLHVRGTGNPGVTEYDISRHGK